MNLDRAINQKILYKESVIYMLVYCEDLFIFISWELL